MEFIWVLLIGAAVGSFAWARVKTGYTIYKQKLAAQKLREKATALTYMKLIRYDYCLLS